MIRRHGSALRGLLMIADGIVATVVLVGVYLALFALVPGMQPAPDAQFDPWWLPVMAYATGWVLLLSIQGAYRLRAHWSVRTEAAGILRAIAWLALVSYAVLFLSDLDVLSRGFTVALFPIQAVATLASRAVLRGLFMFLRRRGRNRRYVLVVGTGTRAAAFARSLEDHSVLGLEVVGMVGDEPTQRARRWPHLGPLEMFDEILQTTVVDEVAICLSGAGSQEVEAILRICQEEGKVVRIPLDVPTIDVGRRFVEDLDGMAVLSVVRGPDQLLSLAVKRLIDVVGAVTGLVVLSPVFLAVTAWIMIRDGRPVLFRQDRVGKHGRIFRIWKFRTMAPDAEERYAEVLATNDMRGAAFKMTDDPRITRSGRILRRTSLDELPQLLNVLHGEMSLVGPRPAPPREVAGYDIWHRRRLSMKPGITGLWQVSARQDDDFDRRAALDMEYIDGWSLWLDVRIVARTVPALLALHGR